MSTPVNHPKSRTKRSGVAALTIRIDQALHDQIKALAIQRGTSVREVVEGSLSTLIRDIAVHRTDSALGPLVDQVLQERHRRLEGGLRKLIALIGYEVLRSQYILLNFITEAGISPGKVDTWREQGWQFAVKELRRRHYQVPEENEGV